MTSLPDLGEPVRGARSVAGGSINDAWWVELESGRVAFVKSRADANAADFQAEAAGLRWLADGGAPVPTLLATGGSEPWLALEWIDTGALGSRGAEQLGRDLAALHRSGAASFGALPPESPDDVLRIGSVRLSMEERAAWSDTYARDLVLPLVERGRNGGTLTAADGRAIESACDRLDRLAGAPEPPARLHGDLWGGNVLAGGDGRGWLIDPAAYGGHREIDLAMLRLFGSPSARIFSAYEEAYPLAEGHGERVALWQILPLLVHAVLFGGTYGRSAGESARRYV